MGEGLKGKIKEKAGWLTDDRQLERDGKREQDEGGVDEKDEDAADAVERGSRTSGRASSTRGSEPG